MLNAVLALATANASSRGVSPYMPLELDPRAELEIEQLLMLADMPVMTRPIPAAVVRDALPAACEVDRYLCRKVARYLARMMPELAVSHFSMELAATDGAEGGLANRHGATQQSSWLASARAYWQPLDHVMVTVGGTASDSESTATGTLLSLGFDFAQLDIGYRQHHLSPFTDSSLLMSANAPPMPSVTISNYRPLTRFNLRYEMFAGEMSESSRILFGQGFTRGNPSIAGASASIMPAPGFALAVNRVIQYGGGERGGRSFDDLLRAFFNPSRFDNTSNNLNNDQQFGNQLASFTARIISPGKRPYSLYFEYAGEDTSRGRNYLLGNVSLSAGIALPRLPYGLDATIEVSEWQNGWYINNIYGDGYFHEGRAVGHWFGDRRVAGDAVGGTSQSIRVGWTRPHDTRLELIVRGLQNEDYGVAPYRSASEFTLRYSRGIGDFVLGAELLTGKDVFGANYSRLAGQLHFQGFAQGGIASWLDEPSSRSRANAAAMHLSVGVSTSDVQVDSDVDVRSKQPRSSSPYVSLGVRRPAGPRAAIGVAIEAERVDSKVLIGIRALDYQRSIGTNFSAGGFIGAARYNLATPAYGIYVGAGVEKASRDKRWSVRLESKYAIKVARDRVLPGEAGQFTREDAFYDISSAMLSISRKF